MVYGLLRGVHSEFRLPARLAQAGSLLRRCGRTLLRCIERSRQRRALAALEHHLLDDISVTRAQARSEAEKSFWR
jgi:uncharacterized protein YjiS (DUF1127 family)